MINYNLCVRDAKLQSCGCIPSMINYNLCVRDAKLQSCGCIPSMINYNLCVSEGGKERKNKVQLDQRKKLEKERNNYILIKARERMRWKSRKK